jgi:succinate dehydrogenase/fumarate reductase flavoprotein subunit
MPAVDVVVVGSGLAGLAAALAAADHGLETVLLEKGELLGGKTAWSNGGLWIPCNDLARDAGIADSLDDARAYLRFLGGGFAVEANLDAYVDGAAAALRYYTELGLRFGLVRNVSDIYYGLAPGPSAEGRMVEIALFPARELGPWREKVRGAQYQQRRSTFDEAVRWGGRGSFGAWDPALQAEREAADARGLGAGLVAAFVDALLRRGVPLRLGTPAERLIVADGRVCGVVAAGAAVTARCGVVLGAGNYENNAALIGNYEELPMRGQFPGGLDGDALVMAAEIGASVRTIPRVLDIFLGYDVPATPGTAATFRSAGTHELPLPHAMVVNAAGRRFGDEAFFQRLLNGLRDFDVATHRFRNLPCFFVFSQPYVEKYGFAGAPPGSVPAFVARAERGADLAALLGIDPAGLAAEIERFNGFVAAGADADFDRGGLAWSRSYGGDARNRNPNLGRLEPPFYGVQLHPTGGTSAGLLTTVDAQVLGQRGAPIPGLYASGDCSAHVDMGCGQQAGISLGRALVFGLAAVRHMQRTGAITRTA